MACDIRLASEKARFGQPEVGLGITPGFGGTQRLARIVGVSNAMELILTAKTINAARAQELGLVSHVYPPEELMDKARSGRFEAAVERVDLKKRAWARSWRRAELPEPVNGTTPVIANLDQRNVLILATNTILHLHHRDRFRR